MTRRHHKLLGGASVLALLLLGSGTAVADGSAATEVRQPARGAPAAGGDEGRDQGPIEILIVQGYVKSIDSKSLTLTAPGAPADLPLRLAPDTRFIQEEKDVTRAEIQEGQMVRAALVPMGEEFLAVVVELVPDEAGQGAPEGSSPRESPQSPSGNPKGSQGGSSSF